MLRTRSKLVRTRSNAALPDEFGHVAGMGFGRRLRELSRALDRVLAARLGRYDLSLPQYFLLRELWHEEGLTLRELAGRVKVSEPSPLVTLDTMERRRLVERRQGEADRRKTHVFLTARGRALRPKVLADVAGTTAECYAGVTPAQLTAALKLFDRIGANAERAITET